MPQAVIAAHANYFSPSRVSGLVLDCNAPSLTGLVDNDPVASFTDRSGLGHSPAQATGSKKPLYKVAIQNGLPIVRFDGVDDLLKAPAFTLVQPEHVFIVMKYRTNGASVYYFDSGPGINGMTLYCSATDLATQYAGGVAGSVNIGTTNFNVISALYNGASSEIRLNGGTAATGDVGAGNAGGFTLGAREDESFWAAIDVGRVLIYNRSLSTPERHYVERGLGHQWGIAVA